MVIYQKLNFNYIPNALQCVRTMVNNAWENNLINFKKKALYIDENML